MAAIDPLPGMYSSFAEGFVKNGINVPAIETMLEWFHDADENGHDTPYPMMYADFNEPLPPNTVRLLIVPVDSNPTLSSYGNTITKEIESLLPTDVKLFKNFPRNYHITIFHTSNPWDPRPNPLLENGGTDLSLAASKRSGPTDSDLEVELEAMRNIVKTTPTPSLVLERIVFASSGTLLMLWTDPAGIMEPMRSVIREKFPGGCTKQPNIIHTSLARLATATQFDEELRLKIQAVCDKWTEQLRGQVLRSDNAWFVFETEFSTIEGTQHVCPFQG